MNLLFYSEGESSVKPSGVIMLEGCYCERLITTNTNTKNKDTDKQFCFAITYRRENQRQYDLKAETEGECKAWIDVIRQASFNKLLLQKEELEQKHLHLLQIVESEKTAKWQYTQQCEELTSEIKKLRAELCTLKKEWRVVPSRRLEDLPEDSEEIKKIKKVQSFFRGWLCRRRWKQIVEDLVFRMVEAEEEYVEQLNLLVSCFLRPFKMAASSKKPPCSHEDVNSIFLNSETLLFLHQIFLKGLSARMESWPTLVLGECLGTVLARDAPSSRSLSSSPPCLRPLLASLLAPLFSSLLVPFTCLLALSPCSPLLLSPCPLHLPSCPLSLLFSSLLVPSPASCPLLPLSPLSLSPSPAVCPLVPFSLLSSPAFLPCLSRPLPTPGLSRTPTEQNRKIY
ncbi:putative ras-specific guanine nucleotide-releasing factor 1-like [Penaeus vannamei]|uniref:Putative ras-specific guanine nucleotide-releasing factor 1-like n=1 Tax=Penaeus vannamei TaxID=6689 RepID=A0A423TUB7_PENVA|nr:putative ras-specific guanine nucleotide-releasing factor 1-like [Penaeus vannamei]